MRDMPDYQLGEKLPLYRGLYYHDTFGCFFFASITDLSCQLNT